MEVGFGEAKVDGSGREERVDGNGVEAASVDGNGVETT